IMGVPPEVGLFYFLFLSGCIGGTIATVVTAISSRFVTPTGRSFAVNLVFGVVGWPVGFLTGLTEKDPLRAAFIVPLLATAAHEFVRWVRHRRSASERESS